MVKITGIGWRLKFYFFLDFVVPINSMLQHTSPPPSLPQALDYSLCPRSRHLKKKAFSRVGYLNVTRVRQGIWTRIVKSFQWNKMSFFFFLTRNMGIWTNQSSEVQMPSEVTQGGGYDVEALYWLTHSVERHSEKVFLEQQRKLCTSLNEATKALNLNNCPPTRDICILYPSQKRMHLWEQTCFRSQSWAKASSLYLGKKGTEPVRKQQMQSKIVFLQK